MKKIIALCLMLSASVAFGGEIDRLVDKLVEKGILTQGEAYRIVAETREDSRKTEVMVKEEMGKVPGWIKNTRFGGDFRLRYEMQDDSGRDRDRHRTRIRFRWGFETKVNDEISAGLRLATGDSSQASSANQTFTNAFDDKNIWLDRAYVKYAPSQNVSLTAGKMSNPFVRTALEWSGDINPEGIIAQLKMPVGSEIFATAGYFPIKEFGFNASDPYLLGLQAGYSGKIAERNFRAAIAYYYFSGLEGQVAADVSPSFNNQGNTLTAGAYDYDYHIFNVNGEITPFILPLGEISMPVRLSGAYVRNIASNVENDKGYLFGVQLGRARNKGSWQASYDYRRLEADAIADFMADGSFGGGGTDCKGHTVGFRYAPSNNSTIGATYMMAEGLGNRKTTDRNVLQVDYAVSF